MQAVVFAAPGVVQARRASRPGARSDGRRGAGGRGGCLRHRPALPVGRARPAVPVHARARGRRRGRRGRAGGADARRGRPGGRRPGAAVPRVRRLPGGPRQPVHRPAGDRRDARRGLRRPRAGAGHQRDPPARGVGTADAALVEPVTCAVHGLDSLGRVAEVLGARVLVVGAGTMGLLMTQPAAARRRRRGRRRRRAAGCSRSRAPSVPRRRRPAPPSSTGRRAGTSSSTPPATPRPSRTRSDGSRGAAPTCSSGWPHRARGCRSAPTTCSTARSGWSARSRSPTRSSAHSACWPPARSTPPPW
nr:hypothetical protein [Angustibacter aerolatus]